MQAIYMFSFWRAQYHLAKRHGGSVFCDKTNRAYNVLRYDAADALWKARSYL